MCEHLFGEEQLERSSQCVLRGRRGTFGLSWNDLYRGGQMLSVLFWALVVGAKWYQRTAAVVDEWRVSTEWLYPRGRNVSA